MVFKRRTPRTWVRFIADGFWPRGGWGRATRYVIHRLRRLPDPAHKISRGIGAGVFVCFTPFFGFHFILSALIALAIRGNILAALLATFVGNPLTFPFIASISMEIGSWALGTPHMGLSGVVREFSNASLELWHNVKAVFGPQATEWGALWEFSKFVLAPYMVGGFLPGLAAAIAAYFLSHPVIVAYQKTRIKRQKAQYERRLAREAKREAKRAEKAAKKAPATFDPAE